LLDKLNRKRVLLYELIDLEQIDSKRVLKISQELDELIMEYYRKQKKYSKDR